MAEMRGQPFAFLAIALFAWAGGRLAMSQPEPEPDTASGNARPRTAAHAPHADQAIAATARNAGPFRHRKQVPAGIVFPRHKSSFGLPPAQDPWQDGGRPFGLPDPQRVAEAGEPRNPGRDTPPTIVPAFTGGAGPPHGAQRKRTGFYAYSFWRQSGDTNAALAPLSQYGGSQSGVIATLDPLGDPQKGVALLLRGSATPDGEDSEGALGLRWKPDANWPLTVSAERRFRGNGPDRFALYLAGGFDAFPLAGKFTLNGYGQAGYATGPGGGHFFDAQARAMHPLTKLGGVPISLGAGGWAGGQRGAERIDVGPTIAAKVDAGPTALLIQLDWRMRAAGNAVPKDGLALTLSTGF